MVKYPKRVYLALGILVPIMLFWGLYETPSKQLPSRSADGGESATSYFKGLKTKQYDDQGQLTSTLRSVQVDIHEATDTSYLVAPVMTAFKLDAKGSTTVITGERGEYNQSTEQLILAGNVSVQDNAESSGLTLTTPRLMLDLSKQTASTNEPVTIKANQAYYQATGMFAWLETSKIELLSQVQGIHEKRP